MKKASKIITILLIVLMIASIVMPVFASSPSSLVGQMTNDIDYSNDSSGISSIIKNIVRMVNIVGVGIAIIILLILGIKYMMGSAEEKADYKKSMIPYLVGAILIFAGTSIVNVVVNLATSIGKGVNGDNAQ